MFPIPVMSGSAVDSTATFAARLKACGLDDRFYTLLVAADIDTMAKMAYVCACVPGVGDDGAWCVEMLKACKVTRADELTQGTWSALRRCWNESRTACMIVLRSQLESTGDSAPKKLPVPERAARFEKQSRKLAGVNITTSLEPSHALVDMVMGMRDDELLKYIDPNF